MIRNKSSPKRKSIAFWILGLALIGLLVVACSSQPQQGSPAPTGIPAASPSSPTISSSPVPLSSTPATTPTATPVPLKALKLAPESGPVGTAFTITGQGLSPGKPLQLQWVTWDGSYVTNASPENVEFQEPKFTERRVLLGGATPDVDGRITTTFTAPEDYGTVHDIYALADGVRVAKGGFSILTTATMTPTEGVLGTPLSITVKGMGWSAFERTLSVRYDNKFMGFISSVTTRGTAVFQIRAAGPVGQHLVQVIQSSTGEPYLNAQQAPIAFRWTHVPTKDFRWLFNVTRDAGPSASVLEWPEQSYVSSATSAAVPRTTSSSNPGASPGVAAALEPSVGQILSQSTLRATGLSPGSAVELFWVTARGNRLSPSGWNLTETSLLKTTVAQDGSLKAPIQVPDDLGGWHVVKVVGGDKMLVEVPYYVERSLTSVNPARVKAGESFTIQVKGIGWTELDNGFAVTYDNGYIGYACGFNSNGDVTMTLVATGGPGTHLIDIYPMIFQGHGKPPWSYEIPQLTALQDHPGLALGYNLPIFRLAVEVTA